MKAKILGEIGTYIASILPSLGFCSLLFYYLLAVSPGLGWDNGPQIIENTIFLYPDDVTFFSLTSLAAKAITWCPLGTLIFRVSIFNAFIATISLYLLYSGIINSCPQITKTSTSKLLSLIITLGFGLSPAYWQASLEAQGNLFTLLFLGLIIYFHLKYFQTCNLSWLMIAIFIYALSVPHYGAMIVFLPVMVLLFYDNSKLLKYGFPAYRFQGYFILSLAILFILGLSAAFTMLFIQNWPENPLQFMIIFFKYLLSPDNIIPIPAWAGQTGTFKLALKKLLTSDITWAFWVLGLPLTLIGGFYLWAQNRRLTWSLILIIILNCLLFTESKDASALLPTFYSAFFLMGCGLIFLKTKMPVPAKESLREMIIFATLLFMIVGGWWRWENRINLGGYLSTEIFWDELETLPAESLFISDHMGLTLEALSSIYRLRDDVSLLNGGKNLNNFQKTYKPAKQRLEAYADFHLNTGFRVYIEPSNQLQFTLKAFDFNPVSALALEMSPHKIKDPSHLTESSRQQVDVISKKLRNEVAENYLPLVPKATEYYSLFLVNLAANYNYWGLPGESLALTDFTLAVLTSEQRPETIYSMEPLISLIAAQSLWQLGKYQESENHLNMLATKYPENPDIWLGLANIHLFIGNNKESLEAAEIATKLSPENPWAFVTLARSQAKNGLGAAALISYQQAINNYNPITQGYELVNIQKETAMWRAVYQNQLNQIYESIPEKNN